MAELTFLGDLLPYETYLRSGYIEGTDYYVNILNSASAGTIRYGSELTTGTKKTEAFFKDFGTIERRDITSDAAQTTEKIERDEHTMFKTFWKLKPVAWSWSAFKTSDNMSVKDVMFMIGKKFAEKKLEYTVRRAISILAAAIKSNANLVVSSDANLTVGEVLLAKAKFGDAAGRLKALVMHSAAYYTLMAGQMSKDVSTIGENLMLYGASPATMGVPVIVTDNPELVGADGVYDTMFLTDSAVTLNDNGSATYLAQNIGGHENIKSIMQGEGDMWNYIKGYQLKSTVGTNPTEEALDTPSNWEKYESSDKLTAGVVISTKADVKSALNKATA
jgi:hypothetical protein